MLSKNVDITAKNTQVATRVLTCSNDLLQQADIRMCSHGLRQFDNKSVASCQQGCCKMSTDLLQVDYLHRLVETCFHKL